jgi:hypothetical protein
MCTTACLQVAMAVLCGQMDLRMAERDPRRHQSNILSVLNWCMEAGSVVHGRVEGMLNRNCGDLWTNKWSPAHSTQQHHMLSVNDIIRILGINMSFLKVGIAELMVCRKGLHTILQERHGLQESGEVGRRCMLKYEPDLCFVTLAHIPDCMQLARMPLQRSNPATDATVAIITAHGHSVAAACYYHCCNSGLGDDDCARYSFFDSLPGQMAVGLEKKQLVSLVKEALNIPVRACGSEEEICRTSTQEEAQFMKGERTRIRKIKRGLPDVLQDDDFYADVTLLHIMR